MLRSRAGLEHVSDFEKVSCQCLHWVRVMGRLFHLAENSPPCGDTYRENTRELCGERMTSPIVLAASVHRANLLVR
jgi:hypothetical protein